MHFSYARPARLLTIAAIVIVTMVSCSGDGPYHQSAPVSGAEAAGKTNGGKEAGARLYGIPVDTYNIVTGHVENNQVIASILSSYGVPWDTIQTLLNKNKDVFNPRKIHTGSGYSVFMRKDSSSSPDYFIYDHDDRVSYLFSLHDSLKIRKIDAQVRQVLKYSSGTITTSLWDANKEKSLNPNLTSELSDIYAWTIDFFGLQKGDRFKVIYEEEYIGEKSVGIGRIHAALFEHAGAVIYAIPFIQDSTLSYFDSTGASLRKAFLKAPLRFSRISSHFSSARMHPILKIVRPHYGVDYAAPIGTPVYSIGDGRVTVAGTEGGAGRIVKITHNSVYSTTYMHLSSFGPGIRSGVYVKQGEIIGFVGSSGLSTGPHLDFRVYKNGSPIDPLKMESPPVDPVRPDNRPKYAAIEKGYIDLLNTINY
jgi:murein DD-endopeptidase MepM/ murein hydrolase activator NlpD